MSVSLAHSGFDIVVIGGSFAGLSAALQLARARQRILVVDAGQRRNRFAATSHGVLGHDGRAPADIVADGRRQLLAYPDVQWRDGTVTGASAAEGLFLLETDAGETLRARRLVLATGVIDILPDVEGLAERWGRSVFHCPYCHRFELERGRIGVLATGPVSMHHALMLPDWGRVTLFTNDALAPDADQRAALQARGVTIEARAVARLRDHATIELVGGVCIELDGVFTASRMAPASPVAAQLGCAFEEGPVGPYLRTNEFKETSVAGVFACGDIARMAGSVSLSIGDGALAGTAAHQSLLR